MGVHLTIDTNFGWLHRSLVCSCRFAESRWSKSTLHPRLFFDSVPPPPLPPPRQISLDFIPLCPNVIVCLRLIKSDICVLPVPPVCLGSRERVFCAWSDGGESRGINGKEKWLACRRAWMWPSGRFYTVRYSRSRLILSRGWRCDSILPILRNRL
jgi:hypothetical protein